MFGNLLKAAANYFALLLLIVVPSSFVLHCFADTERFEACPKSLWRIDFNNSFKQGEANLVFDIPYQDRVLLIFGVINVPRLPPFSVLHTQIYAQAQRLKLNANKFTRATASINTKRRGRT